MAEEVLLPEGFDWAVVEIMGHRRLAGRTREEERFGAKMLRIDVPTIAIIESEGKPAELGGVERWTTQWYGGPSIFSFTLTDEQSVMRINRPNVPAQRYIAPPSQGPDFGAETDVDSEDHSEEDPF